MVLPFDVKLTVNQIMPVLFEKKKNIFLNQQKNIFFYLEQNYQTIFCWFDRSLWDLLCYLEDKADDLADWIRQKRGKNESIHCCTISFFLWTLSRH